MKVPVGFLTYAICGVALTFFFIAFTLVKQVGRESPDFLLRQNSEWRFYSVLGVLTLVIVVQSMGFALSGGKNILYAMDPKWGLILFVFGFVPLPVIWLELIFCVNWPELGFTRYYENNLDALDLEERPVVEKKKLKWFNPSGLLIFLFQWTYIYSITPLVCFNKWKERKYPIFLLHIRQNHAALFGKQPFQFYQTAQDLIVIAVILVFYSGLCCFLVLWFGIPVSHRVFYVIGLSFALIISAAFVLGASVFLFSGTPQYQRPSPFFLILFSTYLISLLMDYSYLMDNLPLNKFLWGWIDIDTQYWIVYSTGGVTPYILALFLIYLMRHFLRQFIDIRAKTAQILQQGLSANFVDRTLHYLGNYMMPPRNTLAGLSALFQDPDKLAVIVKDEKKLNHWCERVGNAAESLEKARSQIDNFKFKIKTERGKKWSSLNLLLTSARESILGEKGFEKACSIGPFDQEIQLFVNRDQFYMVIVNLLDNAVSALRSQGESHPRIDLRVDLLPDNSLVLAVTDNGPGIEKKIMEKIYEPYFSTKGSGSGLGLFLAKEFMSSMSGSISCESRAGDKDSGTEFKLYFPSRFVSIKAHQADGSEKID